MNEVCLFFNSYPFTVYNILRFGSFLKLSETGNSEKWKWKNVRGPRPVRPGVRPQRHRKPRHKTKHQTKDTTPIETMAQKSLGKKGSQRGGKKSYARKKTRGKLGSKPGIVSSSSSSSSFVLLCVHASQQVLPTTNAVAQLTNKHLPRHNGPPILRKSAI